MHLDSAAVVADNSGVPVESPEIVRWLASLPADERQAQIREIMVALMVSCETDAAVNEALRSARQIHHRAVQWKN